MFVALAAGSTHTCGIRANGTLACWGSNVYGESNQSAGVFAAVTAGAAHSCGLRSDGTAVCWGYNCSGQLDAPAGAFIITERGWRRHVRVAE